MIISWLGDAGIRLQFKDTVVLLDPPATANGLKATRQNANLVGLTQNGGRDWKSVAGEPLIIGTPGEFERAGVFVYGLGLASEPSRVHFRVEGEDVSVGHLADLDHVLENGELTPLEGVDILCLPIGGKTVLTPEKATEVISQIEPRIIIPIQYKTAADSTPYGALEPFLRVVGAKNVEPVDKFRAQKKDLPAEDSQVVVLTVS